VPDYFVSQQMLSANAGLNGNNFDIIAIVAIVRVVSGECGKHYSDHGTTSALATNGSQG
jgi:hypothetical protein